MVSLILIQMKIQGRITQNPVASEHIKSSATRPAYTMNAGCRYLPHRPEPGLTQRLNGRAITCVPPDADRSQDGVDQQGTAALTSR